MKKLIEFSVDIVSMIQKYANNNHNGNFTKAVNDLVNKGLKK